MCKGSPRVEGDEDEDDVDDIEHEFKNEQVQKGHMIHGDDNGNSKSGLAKVSLRSRKELYSTNFKSMK